MKKGNNKGEGTYWKGSKARGKMEDGSKGLGEGMGGRLGEGRRRASLSNFLSQQTNLTESSFLFCFLTKSSFLILWVVVHGRS